MAAFLKVSKKFGEQPDLYIGASSDVKPIDNVNTGSEAYEKDTKNWFVFDGAAWIPKPANTTVPAMNLKVEVIRPANTDAYSAGDLINANAAAELPKLSLGAAYANKMIELTGISVITDYQTDYTKMSDMRVYFYNVSTTVVNDNAAFVNTYAEHVLKRAGQPVEVTTNFDQLAALGLPQRIATEICRKIQLNAQGEVYFAPVIGSANNPAGFTPASGQKFTFAFHFFIL